MNIGFDGSRAFIDKKTGTENYSYQLLKKLSLIDHINNYYIYLRPGQNIDSKNWPKNFNFKVINYKRLWTQVGLLKQTFKDKDLDVLFVPSHTLPLAIRPGLKTVITVHDLGAEYLPKTHQLKQKLYLKFMTYYQLKKASDIIAVSEATKDDLIKKVKISPKKITVVYEGYDQNLFKPIKNDALVSSLKYYNLKPETYFLFVGTIQPRKNLERLIKAFNDFVVRGDAEEGSRRLARNENEDGRRETGAAGPRTIKLVLAGSKGWLSNEIYQLPKQLGIEDQVKFLGYVPDKGLPALYSGALGLLFPSLFEGFGLPILEAFSCGCPVLTSNISSMPEVAGKAAILVNPYKEEAITQGIIKLYHNHQLRDQLIKEGFTQAQKFSWQKCAKETLEVLTKVA